MYLVDTSVWIDVFRGKDLELNKLMAHLAKSLKLCTCGVVIAELLRGARDSGDYERLRRHMTALAYYESSLDVFLKAADLGFRLRGKGQTLPMADSLIAATALFYGHIVLTRDSDFQRIPHLQVWNV